MNAVNDPNDIESGRLRRGINRRNALKIVTAGLAGSCVNAFWIEPNRLTVTRRDVVCKRLPSGLEGLRIGLLADFHFRPGADAGIVENALERVREENLDLIALAGDFVDADERALPPLLEFLGEMTAAHGVFAVMGNHDGWNAGGSKTRRYFEKKGISFLINQHSLLSIRGESLAVAGTDFVWLGMPDPDQTLKGIAADTPVLALVHEPDYFDIMTARREILLQVSGHTHGGQCRVPLLGLTPIKVKYGEKYVYGGFSDGASNLFVTRGIGTTGPRVRFACPPELAILTLRGPGHSSS